MWKTTNKSTIPQQLRLTDPGVREQLQALPASQVLIGHGTDGQPVCVDLDYESPHVLVYSASGGGTSTTLRTLAAQLLHNGGHVLVLDLKRVSHSWARALPTVTYRRDIDDIHNALLGLSAEVKRRIHHADEHGDTADLPRLTVVFESASHTLRQLARHWEKVRQPGEVKTSPAVNAYEELLFAGREVRIHILVGAQSFSAALGREHFSTVLLGRVAPRTWSQAAPQIATVPKASTHPGRFHTVQRSTAHPTQVLLMSETDAAVWAATTRTERS
ncbi:helicase HerA domain-containing protein [Streptomyces cyaneofuscatus]|uniref:helicase HerA domain-containing protein n=1 Tax=Streptomyces cyaneofuscatus TaxID=66883 RepID=UPI002F91232B|nr:ATP-binding protein [Streptomyces cyaneofuscatus]